MSFVPTRVPHPPRLPGSVVVTLDGVSLRGRALDLRPWGLSPETVVAAVYEASTPGPALPSTPALQVDCDHASVVHRHVCTLPPESFDLHDALVAAARSRGVVPDSTTRLERARHAFRAAASDHDSREYAAVKRRVADAGREERRLGERVATLRGRLAASRELGGETAPLEAELTEAVGALTEAETERIAAEQRLRQVERAARAARDDRQRRLRLRDRVDNCRRQARRDLVAAVYDDFADAVDALPGDARCGSRPAEYTGDELTAALAVASLARVAAPVVLIATLFGSPAEAATRLDAPVIQL